VSGRGEGREEERSTHHGEGLLQHSDASLFSSEELPKPQSEVIPRLWISTLEIAQTRHVDLRQQRIDPEHLSGRGPCVDEKIIFDFNAEGTIWEGYFREDPPCEIDRITN
jgi:hypothetical protein